MRGQRGLTAVGVAHSALVAETAETADAHAAAAAAEAAAPASLQTAGWMILAKLPSARVSNGKGREKLR